MNVIILALTLIIQTTASKYLSATCSKGCLQNIITCGSHHNSDICHNIYGSSYANGIFRDPWLSSIAHNNNSVSVVKEKPVIDLRNYSEVYDLRCAFQYRFAYYHRLIDCLVHFTPLLWRIETSNNANSAVLMHPTFQEVLMGWYNFTFSKITIVSFVKTNEVILAKYIYLGYRNISRTSSCTYCFSNMIKQNINLPLDVTQNPSSIVSTNIRSKSSCQNRTILYLWRKADRGREMPGYENLLSLIARNISFVPIEIFYGNESGKHVEIFDRAKVVIAGHGAGLANAIFTRSDALIIEITFAYSSGKLWRTNNGAIPKSGGPKWVCFPIPAQSNIMKNGSISEEIPRASPYLLNMSHFEQIKNFVYNHVISQCDIPAHKENNS